MKEHEEWLRVRLKLLGVLITLFGLYTLSTGLTNYWFLPDSQDSMISAAPSREWLFRALLQPLGLLIPGLVLMRRTNACLRFLFDETDGPDPDNQSSRTPDTTSQNLSQKSDSDPEATPDPLA